MGKASRALDRAYFSRRLGADWPLTNHPKPKMSMPIIISVKSVAKIAVSFRSESASLSSCSASGPRAALRRAGALPSFTSTDSSSSVSDGSHRISRSRSSRAPPAAMKASLSGSVPSRPSSSSSAERTSAALLSTLLIRSRARSIGPASEAGATRLDEMRRDDEREGRQAEPGARALEDVEEGAGVEEGAVSGACGVGGVWAGGGTASIGATGALCSASIHVSCSPTRLRGSRWSVWCRQQKTSTRKPTRKNQTRSETRDMPGVCAGLRCPAARMPQSPQSWPEMQLANSKPGPPSSQTPSFAYSQTLLQWVSCERTPQSVQSSPRWQP